MVLEFFNIAGILLLVSCKLVSCKKKRVIYSAGPWRAIWGPGVIYGNGPQWGVWARSPQEKFWRLRPLDSRKVRKMPLLKLLILKNAVSKLCKNFIYESRTLFLCYVLQFWFTPGRCSRLSSHRSLWERTSQKGKKIE